MTLDDVIEVIHQLHRYGSEGRGVEAKRATDQLPRRLWETLSAFANTADGGVILLGVDERDGFSVSGVSQPGRLQADLASMCADQMEPPLRPLIQLWEIDGKTLVTAEVPELPPHQKPCYYRGSGLHNGTFVRVGDGDRKLGPFEVQALLESRGQPHHDAGPVEGTSPADLDSALVRPFLDRLRERDDGPYREWSDERILQTFRVLVPGVGGGLVPSLAGWLCMAAHPQAQFPNLCVTFARYPTSTAGETGPQGERFLDNVRVEGSIPHVVGETLRALKRNMQRRGIVQGLFRQDMWEYPETVLREALVNALGHRDYSDTARGAQVQVHMFPDRLEFISPGGLFGPIQPDQLGEVGVQTSRNSHLMRILEELPSAGDRRPLCENRGTGLVSVLEQLRRAGMSPPRFDVSLTRFRVVIPNHTLYDDATLRWLETLETASRVTETQRQALAFLSHTDTISNADYCRVTGVDSRVATRELSNLVDQGIVERHGTGRWSTYGLPPERDAAVVPPAADMTPSRGEEILHLLASESPLAAREIAERLSISASAVRYWLPRLRAEGRIVPTEDDPNSPRMKYEFAKHLPSG